MRSFYLLLLILFIAAVPGVQAQEFVNGGFDENFFFNDMLNPEQELINLGMDGVYSFGPEDEANIDIITSSSYEGGPETGSWFCGMSGGATDKLALEIEPALVMNQEYTISFYDKAHSEFASHPLTFGLSGSDEMFGDTIYNSTDVAVDGVWTGRAFTFTAPNNGNHLTIVMNGGDLASWVHLDSFFFGDVTSTDEYQVTVDKVYPNPVEDVLNIETSNEEIAQIRVMNIMGQVVFAENQVFTAATQVDLSDLETGNYILEVTYSDDRLKRTQILKK